MICSGCDQEFERTSSTQEYCSQECYERDRAERKLHARSQYAVCAAYDCTTVFERTVYNKKFCSLRCCRRHARFLKRPDLEKAECERCGEVFLKTRAWRKFCSFRCQKNQGSTRAHRNRYRRDPEFAAKERARSLAYKAYVRSRRRK